MTRPLGKLCDFARFISDKDHVTNILKRLLVFNVVIQSTLRLIKTACLLTLVRDSLERQCLEETE